MWNLETGIKVTDTFIALEILDESADITRVEETV
jgi:hypothetical protein